METEQEKLNAGIGTKEFIKLEAKNVKVTNVQIRKVKESMEKVVLTVKHPDTDEVIEISSVKYEKDKSIKTTGLWFKLDSDNKIQKSSALSILLSFYNAESISNLVDKELTTAMDDRGYLCIKAY